MGTVTLSVAGFFIQCGQTLWISTDSSLPSAANGMSYSQSLTGVGGATPYTFSLTSSTGTNTWNVASDGTITGTPSTSEADTLTIKLQDLQGSTYTKVFDILVAGIVSPTYYSVSYSNGNHYVLSASDGSIIFSKDTINFSTSQRATGTALYTEYFDNINYTLYISVGANGTIETSPYDNNYPPPGPDLTWTTQTSGTLQTLYCVTDIMDATFGAKFCVVGANGIILTSTDGASWTTQTSPVATDLRGVAWDQSNTAVIVGAAGVILSSTNGTTWTARTSGVSVTLNNVQNPTFALFVAVGASGTILTSPDGTTWTAQTSGTSHNLNSVTQDAGSGLYMAVGDNGTILSSPDAITWTTETSGTSSNLYSVAVSSLAGNDTFMAVGAAGTIIVSQVLSGASPGSTQWYPYNYTFPTTTSFTVTVGSQSMSHQYTGYADSANAPNIGTPMGSISGASTIAGRTIGGFYSDTAPNSGPTIVLNGGTAMGRFKLTWSPDGVNTYSVDSLTANIQQNGSNYLYQYYLAPAYLGGNDPPVPATYVVTIGT